MLLADKTLATLISYRLQNSPCYEYALVVDFPFNHIIHTPNCKAANLPEELKIEKTVVFFCVPT